MLIKFHPQRRGDHLQLEKQGDALIVNGLRFDFAQLPEGATLPLEAIKSDFFCGPVERVCGELIINLILPHGPNPSASVAFPAPISVLGDGPLAIPHDPELEQEKK